MNEKKFKIGDWVKITKSEFNWSDQMDHFDGKIVQITDIVIDCENDDICIKFENCGTWFWSYNDEHFVRCENKELNMIDQELLYQEHLLQENLLQVLLEEFNTKSVINNLTLNPTSNPIINIDKKSTFDSIPKRRKHVNYSSKLINLNFNN